MKKILFAFSIMALTMGLFTACEPDPVSEADAFNLKTADNVKPTLTIQQLKERYLTEKGVYFPVRTRGDETVAYGKSLFSVDTIAPHQAQDIIIVGRVVSDDFCGNMYKNMVIQDCEHPEQGLKLSVDGSNLSGLFPVGQKIAIRVNDLCIGRYAMEPQLCVPSYNGNIYAGKANEKVGWAPGRIPLNTFLKCVTVLGKPEPDKVQYTTMTIAEIKAAGTKPSKAVVDELCGRLVRVNSVFFNGKSGASDVCDLGNPATSSKVSAVFASTTLATGYTQSRNIEDANGNYLCVGTSEYAKYARYVLPGYNEAFEAKDITKAVKYTGDLIGTLSYYYDNGKYDRDGDEWSIVPRYFPTISPNGLTDFLDFHYDKDDGTRVPWTPVEWSLN